MKHALHWMVLASLVSGIAAAADEPLRALILSGQNNHDWKTTTPELKAIYEASGRFTADVTENPASLTAEALASYDVIVDNWSAFPEMTGRQWGPAAEKAVLDFVRGGKGLVMLHAATACFSDWPEFIEMAGCVWGPESGHGANHRFEVAVADAAHPIAAGMGNFIGASDELYHRLTPQPSMHVVFTAFSALDKNGTGNAEPVVVVTQFGQGRCFYNILGHDVRAMQSAGFKALMLRGTEWAATGAVTIPPPDAFAVALDAVRGYEFGQSCAALYRLRDLVYASLGSPEERANAETQVLAALTGDATVECKKYLCKQLAVAGSDAAVPVLAGLLADADLGDMARYAMEAIPGPACDATLVDALSRAQGVAKAGLLNTLGDRRVAAVDAIAPCIGDADALAAEAAIAALGKIGSKAALDALNANRPAEPLREPWMRARIQCADQIAIEGDMAAARAVYEESIAADAPEPIRLAAFRGLVATEPPAKAAARIVTALTGGDAALNAIAIRLTRMIPGTEATKAFSGALSTLSGNNKVLLIQALADRGDAGARDGVTAAIFDTDEAVRTAAAAALGHLGDASTVPLLAKAASIDSGTREAARASLVRLNGPGVDKAMLNVAEKGSAAERIELIKALPLRGTKDAVTVLLRCARDEDAAVRAEVLAALGELAEAQHVPFLLQLLAGASGDDARGAVEKALVAVTRRSGGVDYVVSVYPNADGGAAQCALLRVLGEAGDAAGLDTLRGACKAEDAAIRSTAVRALSAWPSPEVIPDLSALAKESADDTLRVLALRGFIRLLGTPSGRTPAETVALYGEAMALAAQANEKRQVLAGLAGIASPEAMAMAMESLGNAELHADAATAAMTVAEALMPSQPAAAETALNQLLGASKDEAVLGRARSILAKARLAKLQAQNIAPQGKASSPDDLDSDGGATGDQAAIDGKPETYWDEADGKALYVLQVTFDSPREMSALSVMGYEQGGYAPKDFEVVCDGTVVTAVKDARYSDNLLFVEFPKQTCKEVQLRITGSHGNSPAIRELGIYCAPPQ
ncbi:MAG: ThuA protein [Candidatus Hydrogenedentes bacterium]|nr:ThuA protein [Candidatus Hydrogenedentota bacterium]